MAASRLLYGVPVSQPVRAVLWLCASEKLPIELRKTIPPAQTRSDEYLALNPRGKIPLLQEGDFLLAEGVAIATYLADSHGWDALYPRDHRARAKVHEALSWSNTEVRPNATGLIASSLRADITISDRGKEKLASQLSAKLGAFERILDATGGFAAADAPTLADYFLYTELGQLRVGFDANPATGEKTWDFAPFPNTVAWLDAMAALPDHDAVHAPLLQYAAYLKKQASN